MINSMLIVIGVATIAVLLLLAALFRVFRRPDRKRAYGEDPDMTEPDGNEHE